MEAAGPRTASERDEILACLRERILAFAASRFPRDVAEDLAQEVLLLLHEKYPEVARLEELLPLCLRIMRFKMAALYRKEQRRGEFSRAGVDELPLAAADPSPEQAFQRREMAERLARAVAHLGPRCKELLRLKLAGKTFPEIRKLLGANSLNTVYTWDHRCRRHLLELMGGSWEAKK